MKQFDITGMSCAACSTRVEKAVTALDGVTYCAVSLLTNSMGVEGTATNDEIIAAVTAAGYGASLKGKKAQQNAEPKSETKVLLTRFIVSAGFMLLLMYVAMGHMIGLPMPPVLDGNPLAAAFLQMLLSIVVMIINKAFFVNGFKGIIRRSPNMDSLVSLGSAAAFIYSLSVVFMMTSEPTSAHLHSLYFESSAMILTLITLGKTLEAYSKGKTTSAIKELIDLAPKTATVIRDGKEQKIDVGEVVVDDIFLVRPGESIAVDGVVIEGDTTVNEAALTGESLPVDKTTGDMVSAGAVNQLGFIKCRATHVGEGTLLAKIIKLMGDSAATKAPIAKIADKVSGFFVPLVMLIAVVTVAVWLFCGETVGFALARGISVLVISCPCALGLATPVAIMVGSGKAAKVGVLFKTAEALENIGKTDIVVLDKTGTVTKGSPEVTDIIPVNCSENELLSFVCSLEEKSEHPLAKAIVAKGKELGIETLPSTDFEVFSGSGVTAKINGEKIVGGNFKLISKYTEISEDIKTLFEKLSKEGKTAVFFAKDEKLIGLIALSDTLKEDSKEAVSLLNKMGIEVVLLTGDNKYAANAVANSVGITKTVCEVLPDKKAEEISNFKKDGKVVMVGDGINDAPALATADVGVAIGTGTDIAVSAADVVLVGGGLSGVVSAIKIGKATLRNIKQNLFWAFAYNVLGIPVAAGALIHLFGIELNPMIAAAAMSLSSFCVVTNALRLYKVKLENRKVKKVKTMIKILKSEGMMCPHCEAHVKTALEAVDGVSEAAPDHKTGNITITLTKEVATELLESVVTAQGYKIIK